MAQKRENFHDHIAKQAARDVFNGVGPRGSTPLAEALTACLTLAGKSDKKDFIIVFTDGVPDDRAAAAEVIRKASHAQDTDDALTGCKFDIVDAKTVAQAEAFATTADLVLAAIND